MKKLKIILAFIFDWVWQLPQNLIGLCYYIIIKKDITETIKPDNAGYSLYLKKSKGGISLGKYVFAPAYSYDLDFVMKHEVGHNIQSRMLGPLYLIIIGIPSFLWAMTHKKLFPNKDYYWFYPEKWANKLAGIER